MVLCASQPLRWAAPPTRDALEGKAPQRRPQERLDRRLEEVVKAVGGGYCQLQMPLRLALGVRGTVAGHRLGALNGGRGASPPPSNAPPMATAGSHPLEHLPLFGHLSKSLLPATETGPHPPPQHRPGTTAELLAFGTFQGHK